MFRKKIISTVLSATMAMGLLSDVVAETSADIQGKEKLSAIADAEWRAYIEPLEGIAARVIPLLPNADDPLIRQEQYRQMFSMLAQGYWSLLYQNPDNPDFLPFWYNYGAPNPDDVYAMTPISGDGVYKITGTRGSTRLVTISVGSGMFYPRGEGTKSGPTLADYDLDSIDLAEDGSFEVILSKTRPEGYTGNWWYLDPKGTNIMSRQRAYDWRNEVPGKLAIQRLDRPIIQPRATVEELQENMSQIAEWIESWAKWTIEFNARSRRLGYVNKVEVNGLYDVGGYTIQKYIMGVWDLQPGEALIYETTVPEDCRYWALELVDNSYATLDHMNMNRQASLNGLTARLDADGKFRAVIAAEDPGVPNWLDTAGYKTGGMFGRWLQCSDQPVPSVTKVKTAEVRQHLPENTPVVSAEEREKALRYRRESYQLRPRWN